MTRRGSTVVSYCPMRASIYERWAGKVRVSTQPVLGMDSPCWEWTSALNQDGYGTFSVGRRGEVVMWLAHRIGYALNVGPIPSGLCVCHRCDNPACVAPHHMFLGTNQDNLADMRGKGRGVVPDPRRGEESQSKLTAADIHRIRTCGDTGNALAKQYVVSKSTISRIRLRKVWKDV